ncbi:predicted protein [Arabidopsis lyrata subsp. lyrata]|uniref:Predicted protein n=1 Tax=Arabidopsis lyrata subsp. lyrata TaxID=81972 RepID=D7L470_ARALL|nr:predicted protein [Arabidopsis lyrata subsp. lyrata]
MTPILRLVVVQCYRSRVGRSTFPFTARDFRTSRLGKEECHKIEKAKKSKDGKRFG